MLKYVKAYANYWGKEKGDRSLYEGLLAKNKDRHLETLRTLCSQYSVARSLPLKFDTKRKMRRYEPLLGLIADVRERFARPSDPVEVVTDFEKRISKKYNDGKSKLSLSSKVLWFVYRSPILIYDDYARRALKTPSGDYHLYQSKWLEAFNIKKKEIEDACARFSSAPQFSERWFHERIFDKYLWDQGEKIRASVKE